MQLVDFLLLGRKGDASTNPDVLASSGLLTYEHMTPKDVLCACGGGGAGGGGGSAGKASRQARSTVWTWVAYLM
jgi:hypothetical protein